MPIHATVPIAIEPDAAARVAELRMQAELDRMIEHTYSVVPNLQRINICVAEPSDVGDEFGIIIEAHRKDVPIGRDRTQWDWGTWMVSTFAPDVCRHFVMLVLYGATHAG